MSTRSIDLDKIPLEQLHEVYLKRRKARKKVMRKCLGCKKMFSAREMRTHDCPSGMSYWKRSGYKYDAKLNKYVPPDNWIFNPVTRRYDTPAA
jgi:hypothetical protein